MLSDNRNRLLTFFCTILLFTGCLYQFSTAAETRLRIAAANITSGNDQSYQDPGKRIFKGLKPDIILIQEFNVGANTIAEIDAFVDDAFGTEFVWFREPGSEQIPNGIISRYPILQSGDWIDSQVSNRDFAWARIDIPGDKDLWAVSVHLLTTGTSDRNAEATLLKNYITANVPASDYLVIGGDFNTDNRTESALSTLSSVAIVSSPYPADQKGNTNTNRGRSSPYDWLIADSDLNTIKTSLIIGSSTYTNGLVFDSRVYTPLSEVSPVLYGDSEATNMQHMAVVRDFIIPDSVPDDFIFSPVSIDFGKVNASEAPFQNNEVLISITNQVTFKEISFTGNYASEFSIIYPDLSNGDALINANTNLIFKWNPSANDSFQRDITATIATSGKPSDFQIRIKGLPSISTGQPIDIGDYKIDQINSTLLLTIPKGTVLSPGACLVIGRDSAKSAFETFWGAIPANAIYLNGKDIIAGNGFPLINGSEQFKLSNSSGQQIDPDTGYLPTTPMSSDKNYQRTATNSTVFEEKTASSSEASPGNFKGTKANTGKVVITEVSDASGSGNYIYEFVEIFYDASAETTPTPTPAITPTSTAFNTPTPTITPTPALTSTPTFTPTLTSTPTPTITLSPTATPAFTPIPTKTPILTPTPTTIPTSTPIPLYSNVWIYN